MSERSLPRIVTFDGEARSGKGTVVSETKDFLRDVEDQKVMLVDLGQIFRVLVVAATEADVELNNPAEIDAFLGDETSSEAALKRVKEVYHMPKDERENLIYTKEIGKNSALVGARPLSQDFKDGLLVKWMYDAGEEGVDTALIDGRALETVGRSLVEQKLCSYVLGLYFICDSKVGARRSLGLAGTAFDELPHEDKERVLKYAKEDIEGRNRKDMERAVQPLVRPEGVPIWKLSGEYNPPYVDLSNQPPMLTIDTSAEIDREAMSLPVAKFVAGTLRVYNYSQLPASSQLDPVFTS